MSVVLDRLGVPVRISGSGLGLLLGYRDEAGVLQERAVLVIDDRVVWQKPGVAFSRSDTPRPADGVYLGQSIENMSGMFRAASDIVFGSAAIQAVLKDGRRVEFVQGRVVSVR